MKRLIVNADDFGLHSGVNHGIIEGYRQGCLRSTSFMAGGSAAEEAAVLARENPGLGVGIHLTLVAERPVLSPDKIPSLIGADGRLWPNHMIFIKKFLAGKIVFSEVSAECEAQILRAKALGLSLSHIDSHQHLHVLPQIIAVVLSLARKYGLRKMRLPGEDYFFTGGYAAPFSRHLAKAGLTFCARWGRPKIQAAGILTPAHFFGMLAGGHMLPAHFLAILQALPEGTSEIMVHPGQDDKVLDAIYHWHYHWREELTAITSPAVLLYIKEHHIELISYKELTDEQIL